MPLNCYGLENGKKKKPYLFQFFFSPLYITFFSHSNDFINTNFSECCCLKWPIEIVDYFLPLTKTVVWCKYLVREQTHKMSSKQLYGLLKNILGDFFPCISLQKKKKKNKTKRKTIKKLHFMKSFVKRVSFTISNKCFDSFSFVKRENMKKKSFGLGLLIDMQCIRPILSSSV